jgi:glycosyltransferase involved in cell wall biosynthesis
MRLNWFSPLPPAPSEIASFTAQLLPHFRGRADITLWTPQARWDRVLENDARVRRYQVADVPWKDLHEGHATIYHIGNSMEHAAIWKVSRRLPGIVVLHDFRLQHLFAGLFVVAEHNPAEYYRYMEQYYGSAGVVAADVYRRGGHTIDYMAEHFPLTELGLENALAVLVHSQDNFALLENKGCWPVTLAALPFVGRTPKIAHVPEKGPPYRLIVFGYLSPSRRLADILAALSAMPERDQFRLDIYGRVHDEPMVQSWIRTENLRGLVALHGFVSASELDRALASAHLAINLRNPTVGEASASQLRIWAHALPSLVSSADWFATLPPDTVAWVRPRHEVGDVQNSLRAFLKDPERFRAMGARGRRLLDECHSPEGYVESVLDLAAATPRWHSALAATRLAQRSASEARAWLGPSGAPGWTRRLAETIQELTMGRLGNTQDMVGDRAA